MATDAQIAAAARKLIEEETAKRVSFVRETAEKLWRDTRLSHYDPEAYLIHHENCKNMRHYFPHTGPIPKSTWAILPLPAHPSRPDTKSGNSDGCPSCDVRIWDDCLKKAQVMTNQSLSQASA